MNSLLRLCTCLYLCILLGSCEKDPAGISAGALYQWPVASPDEQGLSASKLQQAFTAAHEAGFIDALLVIKNGCLIAEQYYNGFDAGTPHNVMSVSKSFLSAITGIAVELEFIDSLNQKILPFFPEYDSSELEPGKRKITIRHLLTMQAGYESEYYNYMDLYLSPNWIQATLAWPLKYDPGTAFSYNTFETHLLSAILTKATGEDLRNFASEYLCKSLGIRIHGWEQDPQGYYFGGNSMYFTPREMAVLGYLYLNKGYLNNEQIVPEEWVRESLTNSSGFTGKDWGVLHNYSYGYLWWLGEINTYNVFLALGYGGQFIICFPDLDMIVVSTSENRLDWDTADEHERAVLQIVSEFILTAISANGS